MGRINRRQSWRAWVRRWRRRWATSAAGSAVAHRPGRSLPPLLGGTLRGAAGIPPSLWRALRPLRADHFALLPLHRDKRSELRRSGRRGRPPRRGGATRAVRPFGLKANAPFFCEVSGNFLPRGGKFPNSSPSKRIGAERTARARRREPPDDLGRAALGDAVTHTHSDRVDG